MNPDTRSAPRTRSIPAVVGATDPGYDTARVAWNLHVDQRPAAVAHASTVEEVQDALAYARQLGLSVAPQVTGHLAASLAPLDRSLLLKVDLHDRVEVDVEARRARIKAGALWEHVVEAIAPHGLAAPHGSSPDVGVIGYLVGGGLSFYGRREGLASNHVTAVELVTADGRFTRVDAANEPDLFWAVRGGGGNFGVVCAVELELLELAEVYAGAPFWPVAHAPEVLRAWLDWAATAPPEVTTSARLLCLPPVPDVPEPLRGVPVVAVDGVVMGDPAAAEALMAPVREAAPPMMDQWGQMPSAGVLRLHGDPEQPVPAIGDHALLGDLDDAAVDALVEVAGDGSGSPLLMVELRQLGGALATAPAGAGARGSLEGAFALYAVGAPMVPELVGPIRERLDMLLEAMGPWATGTVYLNFAETGEASAERAYAPEDYDRLRRIRAAHDPDELFVGSQRIEPAP